MAPSTLAGATVAVIFLPATTDRSDQVTRGAGRGGAGGDQQGQAHRRRSDAEGQRAGPGGDARTLAGRK